MHKRGNMDLHALKPLSQPKRVQAQAQKAPTLATTEKTTQDLRNEVLPKSVHAQSSEEQMHHIKEAIKDLDAAPPQVQRKIGKTNIKLMNPSSYALQHPAAPILKDWADNGCPVDCGEDWSMDMIECAIKRGAHISAKHPEAITCIRAEQLEKVKSGYAKLVKWKELKRNFPPCLKISPVAAIPHKSRSYRTILDLSFRIRYKNGRLPSVNGATVLKAPAEAMVQLGNCVQRIIETLAQHIDPNKPFMFTKLDIKDGFWRVAVNNHDAYNFCYVLPSEDPSTSLDKADIIIPNSLQMGWCESPPFPEMLLTSCSWKQLFQNINLRRS